MDNQPPQPPQPVPLLQQGGQSGDQSYGSVAGRDVVHQGIPLDALLRRLDAEITFRDGIVAALQQERKELRARLDRWEQDQDLYRELDQHTRAIRQRELDGRLAALGLRLWLALMIIGMLAVVILIYWLRAGTL